MPPRRRATIVDIAEELGIHPTSVSRALTGSPQVSEATRERVMEVAARLHYVRNVHASGLVTGSSKTIGLLLPDLINPFFAELANHVQNAAMARGYLVMVATSQMSSEAESAIVARMIENVDATIVAIPTSARPLPAGVSETGHIGFVNRHVAGAPSVVVDQEAIVRLQIEAVADAGHRKIAVIDGPEVFESSLVRQDHRRSLDLNDLEFFELGHFDASGQEAAKAYAEIPDEATAVIVFNDIMALGVMAAAVVDGRSVPRDLSVVGSDGLDLAGLFSPSLTTVRAPMARLADLIVAGLIDPATDLPDTIIVQPTLVHGESVAKGGR